MPPTLETLERLDIEIPKYTGGHSHPFSMGQNTLAWLLMQGEFIVPIPGTSKIEHLEENVAAAEIRLSEDDLERVNALFAPGIAAGNRHADDRSKELNV